MTKCDHERQESSTSTGARYCLDCGLRMVTEPGPVYYRALADGRRLHWQKLSDFGYFDRVELHKVYIGARFDHDTRVWQLGRVKWCDDCGHFECHQEGLDIDRRDHGPAHVTHIAPDLLGTPSDAPEPPRLPSNSG